MSAPYSHSYHNQHLPTSQYNDYASQQQQQHNFHQQQLHRQAMSNFAPPPGLSAPRQSQQQPQSMTEWQEGLKVRLFFNSTRIDTFSRLTQFRHCLPAQLLCNRNGFLSRGKQKSGNQYRAPQNSSYIYVLLFIDSFCLIFEVLLRFRPFQ